MSGMISARVSIGSGNGGGVTITKSEKKDTVLDSFKLLKDSMRLHHSFPDLEILEHTNHSKDLQKIFLKIFGRSNFILIHYCSLDSRAPHQVAANPKDG